MSYIFVSLSSIIYYNHIVTGELSWNLRFLESQVPGTSGSWESGSWNLRLFELQVNSWNLRFLEVRFLEPPPFCMLSACIDKDSQFVHNLDEMSNILGDHFVI